MQITLRIVIVNLLFLQLFACQTIENRGQFIENHQIESIKNQKLSKSEVINLIGSPNLTPEYSPNTWYYVHRSLSKRAWLEPKVIEQRVVEVKFNKNNVLEQIILIENNHQNIGVIKDYTKTFGTESTKVQKFVKHIGRYNKALGSDSKKKKR